MNKGKKASVIAGLVAAGLLGGSLVSEVLMAQAGPAAERGHPAIRAMRGAFAALNLTQDQREKIKGIVKARRPALKAMRDNLRVDRDTLQAAASAGTPDPAAVGNAFLKLRSDRQATRTAFQGLMGEVKGVLTTEQKARLEGYLAAVRQRGRWMRGRGMGPGGPQS